MLYLLSFPNVFIGNPEIAQTLDPRLIHSGVTPSGKDNYKVPEGSVNV